MCVGCKMGASVGAGKRRYRKSPAANLLAVSKKATGLLSLVRVIYSAELRLVEFFLRLLAARAFPVIR